MTPGQETAQRYLDEAVNELNEASEAAATNGLDQTITVETTLLHGTEARSIRIKIKANPLPYLKNG
jgi:hypothetical protein